MEGWWACDEETGMIRRRIFGAEAAAYELKQGCSYYGCICGLTKLISFAVARTGGCKRLIPSSNQDGCDYTKTSILYNSNGDGYTK
jgi:hypothetical protein